MQDWRGRTLQEISVHLERLYGLGTACKTARDAAIDVLSRIHEPEEMTDAYCARVVQQLGIGEGTLLERTTAIFRNSLETALHIASMANGSTPRLPDASRVEKGDIWVDGNTYAIGAYEKRTTGGDLIVIRLLVTRPIAMLDEIMYATHWMENTRVTEMSRLRNQIDTNSRTHILETRYGRSKGGRPPVQGYALEPRVR